MTHLDDLFAFLRFPSVSADSQFKSHVEGCAEWVSQRLQKAGLESRLVPTAGNPVVLGHSPRRPDRKTVLIYGHYDVQPADPLNLWETPDPFEPVLRDGRVIARGATDNKGQILAHILGVEQALARSGELPVNVIFLIEGEEETGSPHLETFLRDNAAELAADVVTVSDTTMVALNTPTFTYGLRGIVCLEIRITGPAVDLHSGIFGGSVENPATVLSRLIGGMHDENCRIAIPGFYERVQEVHEWERKLWSILPIRDKDWLATTGSPALSGEAGFSTLERVWARPTAEVDGLNSGYQGEGPKTIVPSKAIGKLSFRLVPDQTPDEIREKVVAYLKNRCPKTVRMEIIHQHSGKPYLVNPDSGYGRAANQALERTFDRKTLFIREGGSIPITQSFKDVLHLDTLLLGLALPDAKAHSPNENFPVENFEAGIRLNQNLLEALAATT
jgi:acetylornithine deacetylase/succinyl-diaminopimelate desuccinylase-like protein